MGIICASLPRRAGGRLSRSDVGIKKGYRFILLMASSIAGIALLCHFALMLWAQHEFSSPESVVASQSMMLAHKDCCRYWRTRDYPYTVNAYMPLFYLLDAALIKAGLGAYTGARLISFAAMLGVFCSGAGVYCC